MTRPLFLVGNKRSGTSQLVRLLNLHPKIFIAHESDVLWILYQFHNRMPFASHPWDSPRGMNVTLKAAGHLLSLEQTPRQNFFALQSRVMAAGNPWMKPLSKSDLVWSGDKKPFQHGDPRLVDFAAAHFPDAAFIHIVRHPFSVALSAQRFNHTPDGDFWKGLSLAEMVERWTFHEDLVAQLERRFVDRVHTLRYEDLCADPVFELQRLLNFLQLDGSEMLSRQAKRITQLHRPRLPGLPFSEATQHMAARHGYALSAAAASRLAMVWDGLCWRWRHWRQP